MTQPGSIGAQVPQDGFTRVNRDIADLRRQIRENAAARTLNAATIDAGGISVIDGGAITVGPSGGTTVVLSVDNDGVNDYGKVTFTSAFDRTGDPASLTLLDPSGAPDSLVLSSPTDADGSGTFVQLGDSTITLEVDSPASSTPVASLSLYNGECDLTFPAGGVSFRPNAVDAPAGVTLYGGTGTNWAATALGTTTTYVPIKASAFTVSSTSAVKHDVGALPFDPLQLIAAAPAKSWRYLPEHAADQTTHFSPLADDLPAELVVDDSVDLRDLVGVLWAAVGTLAQRLTDAGI